MITLMSGKHRRALRKINMRLRDIAKRTLVRFVTGYRALACRA
jgi:hypothetical protein